MLYIILTFINILFNKILKIFSNRMGIGDWGLGIGD